MLLRRFTNLFPPDMPGRFKLLGAGIIAAVAVIALGFTIVYRVNTSRDLFHHTVQNCVQIEKLKAAIVLVFDDGRANLEAQRSALTPSDYQARLRYYDRQYRRFAPSPCPEKGR